MCDAAGGEGHHDGRSVPGAGAGPSQGEGGPLGSRLALHAGQHHRSLADLLPRCPQSVRLQGECPPAAAAVADGSFYLFSRSLFFYVAY